MARISIAGFEKALDALSDAGVHQHFCTLMAMKLAGVSAETWTDYESAKHQRDGFFVPYLKVNDGKEDVYINPFSDVLHDKKGYAHSSQYTPLRELRKKYWRGSVAWRGDSVGESVKGDYGLKFKEGYEDELATENAPAGAKVPLDAWALVFCSLAPRMKGDTIADLSTVEEVKKWALEKFDVTAAERSAWFVEGSSVDDSSFGSDDLTRPSYIERVRGRHKRSQDPDPVDVSVDCGVVAEDGAGVPLNQIFYGPPGTGKTYKLGKELAPRFGPNACFLTFHQSYGYEGFIEGIRPLLSGDSPEEGRLAYECADGVFLRAVRSAIALTGYDKSVHEFCTELTKNERADLLLSAPRYAVFVDEINRGNVARIFGELITLLEPSKRLGMDEELIVTLPTSGTSFGVPSNLHLIGTMNTADRSVEALDSALRRRFVFEECPPHPELLDSVVEGDISPRHMLQVINARLLKLLDRDHLIGHAYFIPLNSDRTFERLQAIFRDSIVPLLQEYFYGDWGRIGLVLGEAFVRSHDQEEVRFADFGHEDIAILSERPTYECVDLDTVSAADYRRIYTTDA